MKLSLTPQQRQRPINGSACPPVLQRQDEVLMRAIQHRDPRALAVLFQRYRLLLKSVILRVIHDDSAADDVMQDSILEIWRHADHYSAAKGKPLGWMVTVSKRRAIDHLRRRQAYSHARERIENDMELRPRAWNPEAIDETVEHTDLSTLLHQLIKRLPEGQQEVIYLAYFRGMSQREIAHTTETPLGTVKTRMELGLKKLRAALRTTADFDEAPSHHRS